MNIHKILRFVVPCVSIFALSGGPVWAKTTGASSRPTDATVLTSSKGGVITSTSGSFNSGPVAAFENVCPSRMLKSAKQFNLMYTFQDAVKVNGYGICAGGSWFGSDRGPKAWKIYGSNDYAPTGATGSTGEGTADGAATWVELDSRSDETDWTEDEYRYYAFANATKYTTYKIDITANNGNSYTQWKYMEYCYEPSCSLTVSGVPVEINAVEPAFGKGEMPSGSTTFTSSETAEDESGSSRTACTGWKVYTWEDDSSAWVEDVSRGGTGCSFTWTTMPTVDTKVEWQYATEYLVSSQDGALGSVEGAGWIADGSSVTLTARPASGYGFVRWAGDVPVAQITQNPLALDVSGPLSVKAVFLPIGVTEFAQYVAPEGLDENDGFTASSPKATIAAALSFFSATPDVEGRIYLLPGTHAAIGESDKVPLEVSIPVALVGKNGTPGEIVVNCGAKAGFYLNHSLARLSGVTIANGKTSSGTYAGSITVGSAGGTVENCIVSGGIGSGYGARTGGVRMNGGRMTHTLIRNCSVSDENGYGGVKGTGLEVYGGLVENSVITNNVSNPKPTNKMTAGVVINSGTLRSCTIVGNVASKVGGVWAYSAAQVVDCAIFANMTKVAEGATPEDLEWCGTAAAFDHCATDNAEVINDTCLIGTTSEAFENMEAGNLLPKAGGLLVNSGADYAGVEETDFAGQTRSVNGLDIGAYENQSREITVSFTLSSTFGGIPASCTFQAMVSGAAGTVTAYKWDFDGDGTVDETTTEASVTHVYAEVGTYTVTLSIETSAGETGTATRTDCFEAVELANLYVNPDSVNPLRPYNTPEKAARTISLALAYAEEGTVVHVAPGTYQEKGFVLEKGVAILGAGTSPEAVVVDAKGGGRVFELRHASARISNLTVAQGYVAQTQGSGVRIYEPGGMVSNCVIRNCWAYNYYSGAAVKMESANAVVTHCVIRNNTIDQDHEGYGVIAVDVRKGRLSNSLLYGNGATTGAGYAVVYAAGVDCVIENCTVVDNETKYAAGIYARSGAQVVNCVSVANTISDGTSESGVSPKPYEGVAVAFDHCATDGAAAINASCKLATTSAFQDYENGDYTPMLGGALWGAGTSAGLTPVAADLAGNPRVCGRHIDIGCYESQAKNGMMLIVR